MYRILFILLIVFPAQLCTGQEHPFLSHFSVSEGYGNVRLDWTMTSGNTCFGILIMRSLDGIVFDRIGEIDGLCGNISEPVDYVFTDEFPVQFSELYYRLELGVNGPSSIQSIYFDQLVNTDQLVVYSDQSGGPFIYLDLPSSSNLVFELYDIMGKMLFSKNHIYNDRIELSYPLSASQIYIYSIGDGDRKFNGRVAWVR